MENWINVHTHKAGAGINIVDPCIAWPENRGIGTVFYSMGIHPVFIDQNSGERLTEIEKAIQEKQIVAVGEAGVDRNATTPVEVQTDFFRRQADLAAKYDLPLIIHGVRAIPEIIGVYKKCPAHQKWIMHGFNNRREILQDLLHHGFYISAGRHVMKEESHIYQLLPEIPPDRLFIETDNSDFSISEIYQQVARCRGISVEELQQIVRLNFERVFQL